MRAMRKATPLGLGAPLVVLGLTGCPHGDAPRPAPSASASASAPAPVVRPRAPVREGGALARAADGGTLYVADEDQGVVRCLRLPISAEGRSIDVAVPGPPAQVLPLAGRVLVTVRGVTGAPGRLAAPGLLLIFEPDAARGLVEKARVELPADAWGVAVTGDEQTALVTSAWTHRVSAVDLDTAKVRWSVDVAREPRGVTITAAGRAYVTHLVRASLTRLDDLGAASPKVTVVRLSSAPLRTPKGPDEAERAEAATLGYAPVLSPDGARLFVARQALGATGKRAWNGQPTVDVLLTADDTELAPPGLGRSFQMLTQDAMKRAVIKEWLIDATVAGPGPTRGWPTFVAPRAVVYRRATRTLLVASEGTDTLVELDALSLDPSAKPLRTYAVAGAPPVTKGWTDAPYTSPADELQHAWAAVPPGQTGCGAPSGVALSADEATAWVFCRSTDQLATVPLDGSAPVTTVTLGKDPLPEQAALGRRLFYDARDQVLSGSFACSGCHPDGRDDGHVWHEVEDGQPDPPGPAGLSAFALRSLTLGVEPGADSVLGVPRRTTMLAGKLTAEGPYGWKGRSKDLQHRLVGEFKLHRWDGFREYGAPSIARSDALIAFLRAGLVAPPQEAHPPTPEEERGRAVFLSAESGCAKCHPPDRDYTNHATAQVGSFRVDLLSFEKEKAGPSFKVPSLRFVGGTAPYFHDGSAATLGELLQGGQMGHSNKLPEADRAALLAFLRTL